MAYTKVDNENIIGWLKGNLSEDRFIHTIGTAECARELAERYGLSGEKAYIAGLLHDCAKCFPKEKLLEIIKDNLEVDECEMLNYKTLHAPVSAFIAETEFGVTDIEILLSIRWHTLGRLDMSEFEKIIFLADKIEPNTRDKSYCDEIQEILKEENGLNKALLRCYKETIKSLVERDLKICLITVEIYNMLEELV